MRLFLLTLIVASAALASYMTVHADQNPTPTSVGMSNFSTFTLATTTAIAILPRNTYRAGLFLQNQGAVSVVVKPGSAPANATDGIVLTAGQSMQLSPTPVDALYGISASSTAKVVMIEFSK